MERITTDLDIKSLYLAFSEVARPAAIYRLEEQDNETRELYLRLLSEPLTELRREDLLAYFNSDSCDENDLAYFLPRLLELWAAEQPRLSELNERIFNYHFLDFFNNSLTPRQRQACLRIIDGTLFAVMSGIERLTGRDSAEHTRPELVWPRILYTRAQLGAIRDLWNEWWSLENAGQARAALQYASLLIVGDGDNPVFTRHQELPTLTEGLGSFARPEWLPINSKEFSTLVTINNLAVLIKLCQVNLPDIASQHAARELLDRLTYCSTEVQGRIRDLYKYLAGPAGKSPQDVISIVRAMKSKSIEERICAVYEFEDLVRLRNELTAETQSALTTNISVLLTTLKDEDARLRYLVTEIIGELGTEARPALLAEYQSSDRQYRAAIGEMLDNLA